MIRIIKSLFSMMPKEQIKKIPIVISLMFMGAIIETFSVSMLVPLVSLVMDEDKISDSEIYNILNRFVHINSPKDMVIIMFLFIAALFIIKNIFLYYETKFQIKYSSDVRRTLQDRIYKNCIDSGYEYYLSINTGDIQRNIMSDAYSVYNVLIALLSVATESFISVFLIIALVIINPLVAVSCMLIISICMLGMYKLLNGRIVKNGRIKRDYTGKLNQWILQTVDNIKEIKVMNREDFFKKSYEKRLYLFNESDYKYMALNNAPRLVIEGATVSGVMIVLCLYFVMGMDFAELVPQLSAFVLAAVRILPSANRISAGLNDIKYFATSIDHVRDAMKPHTLQPMVKRNRISELKCEICMSNISYKYPDAEEYIFKNLNLKIRAGETIGIIGESGAGKTTLINLLLGLLDSAEGVIVWDGIEINDTKERYQLSVGYIPQQINLLDDSIINNIVFGAEDIDKEKLDQVIKDAQLGDLIKSLPEGLETEVGDRGVRLSGGQRQRLGIARALYSDPALLVLDEATSALDNETEKELMEAIDSLKGKKTMVIIAHRISTLAGCDLIYKLNNGKLSETDISL
ncbi:MAG: ABC transporter ATP-binding protein [Roseburia sp.]|jgi:ABC-type multidrug transport system fused ATPase/permease subunit|nr:ABC transporter ATP-binding protein [Roseburia sp.]